MLTLEIRGSKQSEYLYEPDSFVPLAKLESAAHVQRPEHKAIHPKKVASLLKTAQTDSEQKEAPAQVSQAQEAIESEASVEAVKEKVKDFSVYYYHCDQIGAPQELTDEQGHIVWAAEYKVWGRTEPLRLSATGTDDPDPYDLNRFWPGGPRDLKARSSSTTQALNQVEQNLRFQGQCHDHESGLHYNRFRYYDPQTGRFVHQDPIGLEGGENPFWYAPNPFYWSDVFGLKRKKTCGCHADPCGLAPHGSQPSPRPSGQQSHHTIQDKWAQANNIPGYSRDKAPAILLDHSPQHVIANTRQAQRAAARVANGQGKWSSTIQEEFNEASKDLRAAGVSDKCRKKALKQSYKYFDSLGAFK